jgi:hypothetical protein
LFRALYILTGIVTILNLIYPFHTVFIIPPKKDRTRSVYFSSISQKCPLFNAGKGRYFIFYSYDQSYFEVFLDIPGPGASMIKKVYPARVLQENQLTNHQSSRKGGNMEPQENPSTSYSREEEKSTGSSFRSEAERLKREAGSEAKSAINQKKGQFADRLDSFVGALRQTSEQLKGEESGQSIAGYMEKLTEKIEEASDYLHQKDVQELKIEGERLVRERPALILGGVFITGFVLARVLKNAGKPVMREWKQAGGYYGGNQ